MDFPPVLSPFLPRLPHPPLPAPTITNTLGILTTHLLPSLTIHSSLSLLAYSSGRFTNRLDAKDLIWPSAFVINAWYHGVIHPYMLGRAGLWEYVKDMGYSQKLVLLGVTTWGVRLFVKVFMRVKRRGGDDGRYTRYRVDAAKAITAKRKQAGEIDAGGQADLEKGLGEGEIVAVGDAEADREMWNKAFLGIFLPEGIVQSFVSLGWCVVRYSKPVVTSATAVVTAGGAVANAAPVAEESWRGYLHAVAIGAYAAGLALEMIADSQLQRGKRKQNEDGLVRDGVWSIVRHPNYFGDILVHLSFPLLSLADGIFNPVMFIGPITNYVFLRFIGGDRENETYQLQKYKRESPTKYQQLLEWKGEKNSFWPSPREVGNAWTWALVGIGGVAAAAEWFVGTRMGWRTGF